jgi:hypothetical protein
MENDNNDLKDWEENPHLYLTDSDGGFILKNDGTPRKKGEDLKVVSLTMDILMNKKQNKQQDAQSQLNKKQLKRLKDNLNQREKLLDKRLISSVNSKMNRQSRQNRGR